MDHAQLRLRRTGGIAGRAVEAAVDTAQLSPDEAGPILAALDAASLESPELDRRDAAPGPPDAFRYELEVTRAGATRRLCFGELDTPASLRPVLALLRSRANPVPR